MSKVHINYCSGDLHVGISAELMLAEGLCLAVDENDLVGVGVLFAQKRVRASETFTVQFDSGLWELRTSFEGGLFFSQVRWTKGKPWPQVPWTCNPPEQRLVSHQPPSTLTRAE